MHFLVTFILLTSSILAHAEEKNIGLTCLQTSRFVMFTKAINTIESNYADHMTEQFNSGHYSSFEYNKIKKDKISLLPKSLCSEDIIMSIKEFTKAIRKNCLQQTNQEDIKLYTREIASDIIGSNIKTTKESLHKSIPAALNELKDSVNAFNKCNREKSYIRKISSINMYGSSKKICFNIIDIMNQAKRDKSQCP